MFSLLIFFFSFILRLIYFTDFEFKMDQGLALFRAGQFWLNGHFSEIGLVSSIGLPNPPLFIYLLMLPTLITSNPLFLTFLFVLAGALAVTFLFIFLRKIVGFPNALFATLLFAASPWAILYSRSIWQQNLLPLMTVLILWSLYSGADLMLISLTLLAFQIHFSGLLIIPFTAYVLFKKRNKVKLNSLIWGFTIGLLPLIPYLYFNFVNFREILSLAVQNLPGRFSGFTWQNLGFPFSISTGLNFDYVLGKDYGEFLKWLPLPNLISAVFFVEIVLILAGLILAARSKRLRPVFVFFIFLHLGGLITGQPAHMSYYELFLPLDFIFLAISLVKLTKIKSYLSWSVFTIILIANLIFSLTFLRFIHTKKQIRGDYGLVYAEKTKLLPQILNGREPSAKNFLIGNLIVSGFYFDESQKKYVLESQFVPLIKDELFRANF